MLWFVQANLDVLVRISSKKKIARIETECNAFKLS